ncbi:putative nonstructural protein [Eel River basin pequenovirus]|nr:putative nonstructural protein [Eel River basin pequenovirus]
MKHKIVSVYDSAAAVYNKPFPVGTTALAVRGFVDALMAPDSDLAKHPTDYSLFIVAEFDDNTGTFTSVEPPECLAKAHELLAEIRNQEHNTNA